MAWSNVIGNDVAELLFNAVAIANIADNAASSPLTNLWVTLHTGDPGVAGNATTSECAYGSYARVAVARSGAGWVVTGKVVSPAANVDFPTATSGTETATHFGVTIASSGASALIGSGPLSPTIAIATSVTPRVTTSSTITLV